MPPFSTLSCPIQRIPSQRSQGLLCPPRRSQGLLWRIPSPKGCPWHGKGLLPKGMPLALEEDALGMGRKILSGQEAWLKLTKSGTKPVNGILVCTLMPPFFLPVRLLRPAPLKISVNSVMVEESKQKILLLSNFSLKR